MNFLLCIFISWSALCSVGAGNPRNIEISDLNLENDTLSISEDGFLLQATITSSDLAEEDVQLSKCSAGPCFRKCCPMGEFLTNKTCQPTEVPFILGNRGPSLHRFTIINGFNCDPEKQRLLLDPSGNYTKDEFVVQLDGKLFVPSGPSYYDPLDYCVDFIEDDGEDTRALICAKQRDELSTKYYFIGN